ncbi:MAG: branched-chain amino acid ABC transporter permease [Deltaproteobacteria bacterium]|nr:branched-chain amino acid ABC transporter permease [Deltaproteobacteria bacterium]
MLSKGFRESYREDIKLFQTIWIKVWLGLFLVLFLILPLVADAYIIYLVNLSEIAILGALGLNILTGCTGQISLGHAAFMAIGAYTVGILTFNFDTSFWIALPLAGVMSAAAGVVIGIPCLRLKGLYLAMATMVFGEVITHLSIDEKFYYLMFSITALLLLAAKNMLRTKVGRAFIAIRDRDIAAESMGVSLTRYKVLAFALSSFYVGIAGGFYAYYTSYVHPEHFNIMLSIEFIAMIIIGGMGTVLGSIFGAIFITLVPEGLRWVSYSIGQIYPVVADKFSDDWNIAFFGLLIMLFLIFEPGGLVAIWERIKTSFKTWPFTY